jgi:hypothetical protein
MVHTDRSRLLVAHASKKCGHACYYNEHIRSLELSFGGEGNTTFRFPSLVNPTVVLHVMPCLETATNGGLWMLESNKQMTFSCEYKRTKVMWGDVHFNLWSSNSMIYKKMVSCGAPGGNKENKAESKNTTRDESIGFKKWSQTWLPARRTCNHSMWKALAGSCQSDSTY